MWAPAHSFNHASRLPGPYEHSVACRQAGSSLFPLAAGTSESQAFALINARRTWPPNPHCQACTRKSLMLTLCFPVPSLPSLSLIRRSRHRESRLRHREYHVGGFCLSAHSLFVRVGPVAIAFDEVRSREFCFWMIACLLTILTNPLYLPPLFAVSCVPVSCSRAPRLVSTMPAPFIQHCSPRTLHPINSCLLLLVGEGSHFRSF